MILNGSLCGARNQEEFPVRETVISPLTPAPHASFDSRLSLRKIYQVGVFPCYLSLSISGQRNTLSLWGSSVEPSPAEELLDSLSHSSFTHKHLVTYLDVEFSPATLAFLQQCNTCFSNYSLTLINPTKVPDVSMTFDLFVVVSLVIDPTQSVFFSPTF